VPVILNADVFKGRNLKSPVITIEPARFINDSIKYYPNGVISLGWTTNDNTLLTYSWSNVYEAYDLLRKLNIINSNTQITFAVRALWATKSLFRLLWLQIFTKSTLTIWSHQTDQLSSLDSLLLFRKFFSPSSVYYDLPKEQDEFLKKFAYNQNDMNTILKESKDKFVINSLKNTNFMPDFWNSLHGTIYQNDYGALMINNGASFITRKEYKAKDGTEIFEVSGKFEVFSTLTNSSSIEINQSLDTNNNSSINENNDNNIEVLNLNQDNIACVRISLRTSSLIDIYDDIKDYQSNHSPGSINVYLYTSGLVKIFIGNKLEQEATLQAANNFEYFITDVGKSQQVHIDLNSYDNEMNKYSIQFLIKCDYQPEQQFYVTQTLLSDFFAVGIDMLKISDEISDPQDRDSEQNESNLD
jgi:hypothetical protein